MQNKLTILLTLLFIGFVGLGISSIRDNQVKLQQKEIKLQDVNLELNKLRLEKEQLNQEFEKATSEKDINEERVRQLEQEKLELEEKTRQLERDLQAKRSSADQQRVAGENSGTKTTVSGNKQEWLAASGIPESEWWAVDSIVSRESSWNPNAVNKSSGACGLGQQLPCGKWPGAWNDPVAALKAQYEYVKQRYGGYAQAVAFWNKNHWY